MVRDAGADLLFPVRCVGCGRAGAGLCGHCASPGALVHVALPGVMTVAAGAYEGALRLALLHYKERGRRDLTAVLARFLWTAVAASTALPIESAALPARVGAPTILVPVPSVAAARRERGGNHMLRLGVSVAASADRGRPDGRRLEVVDALIIAASTRDAAGLSRHERVLNVASAMTAVPPPMPGSGRAVIIDDIVTSGATVREAARALRAAGWAVHGAAVVAATRRKRH